MYVCVFVESIHTFAMLWLTLHEIELVWAELRKIYMWPSRTLLSDTSKKKLVGIHGDD